MNIIKFISLLVSKWKYLLLLPILAGVITYFQVKDLPKQYTANTTVYSGVTSNSGLNVGSAKIDKVITQNEYSNIVSILKSRSLFEEISLRLLARHLSMKKPVSTIISDENYQKINNSIPVDLKNIVVKGNEENTYQNIRTYLKADEKNFVYRLLNNNHPFYSINAISKLKGDQVDESDLFRLTYQTSDPGVCYNTVQIAANVLIRSYAEIKLTMKSSAVNYFQEKLAEVSEKLNKAENKLLAFNVDNTIINYYEQTKQVTTQHQEIELKLQDAKMNYEAAIAVLSKIENEVARRLSINLRNIEVLKIRAQLVDVNNKINNLELSSPDIKDTRISNLYANKQKLENSLKLCIDSIYNIENSTQGIEYHRILGEWLDAITSLERSKAIFKSMQDRKAEFMLQFIRYAPLGATIKRIEREISVHEREYLGLLDNLNSALQNEKNSALTSNMKIIDQASYPINSIPSKKNLYIIIAVLLTLIFYIAALFIIELMDNRVKTPSLLASQTGFETISAFSIPNNKHFKYSELITEKSLVFIYDKVKEIKLDQNPIVIQISSNWQDVGQNMFADLLSEKLSHFSKAVLYLDFKSLIKDKNEINVNSNFSIDFSMFINSSNYTDLLGDALNDYDYLLVLYPPISEGIYNTSLFSNAKVNFFVYNSNMTWSLADQFNINRLKSIVKTDLFGVLTHVQPNNLEELFGEIPKKRSKLRILIKQLLSRFINK